MDTQTTEIADGIYRFSTFVPDVGPTGFTFNQYLIDDDQPLLFHTGLRAMFPSLAETMARITALDRVRWITFGHVEADECGAMNELLSVAPHAEVAHGALGCLVSLNDMADRPPVPLTDGQVVELGAHRVRHIDTPHVPHGWEARVLYEETTNTLLCGDLFTQLGRGPAITTDDIVGAAAQAEDVFGASCLTPNTGPTIRRLADLAPGTLAVMHGSCFTGDGESALLALADEYDSRLADGSSASTAGPSPS
ncbi:MAG TPA: MBL fold metallo-hydrolase [Acidimicrobiales bacterium]|nr:MBL fold metallo-hydrolase [Acidimicrobiales bacterium]